MQHIPGEDKKEKEDIRVIVGETGRVEGWFVESGRACDIFEYTKGSRRDWRRKKERWKCQYLRVWY